MQTSHRSLVRLIILHSLPNTSQCILYGSYEDQKEMNNRF